MLNLYTLLTLHIVAFLGGGLLGWRYSARLPASGFIGLVLAFIPIVGYCLTSWISVPLILDVLVSTAIFFLAPIALFYSLHAYRRASDRHTSLAALVSSIIVATLGLIGFIGIIIMLAADTAPTNKPTFEAASKRVSQTQMALERAGQGQEGEVALASKATSEFLRKMQILGEDFAKKTKSLNSLLMSNLGDVHDQHDLQNRMVVVRQFIEANDRFGTFSKNRDQVYRDELAAAGVSAAAAEVAMEAFSATPHHQKPWAANRQLAEAELELLTFLDTHWGKWSYSHSENAIEFDTTSLTEQYSRLSARVAESHNELIRLQEKSKLTSQP